MSGCSFETTVQIGCDSCAFQQKRIVANAAVNVLGGLNTSGVPLKVAERVEISPEAIPLQDSKGQRVEVGGDALCIENSYTGIDAACSPDNCMFEGRILQVTSSVEKRIVELTR